MTLKPLPNGPWKPFMTCVSGRKRLPLFACMTKYLPGHPPAQVGSRHTAATGSEQGYLVKLEVEQFGSEPNFL